MCTNPFSHTTVSSVVPSSTRNGLPLLKVTLSWNISNAAFMVFLLDSLLNKSVIYSSSPTAITLLSLGIFPLMKHFLYDTVSLHWKASSTTIPLLQTRTGHISRRNWHHRELFFCSHTWRGVFSSSIIPGYNYSTSRVLFFGSFLGWCHFSPSHWQ